MLKITLATGEIQEVAFNQASTLTVSTPGFVDGIATPITSSFSEISDVEITTDPVEVQPVIAQEDPPAPPVPTSGLPVDTTAVTTEPTSPDPVVEPVADPGPGADAPVDGSGNPIDPAADVVVPAVEPDPEPAPDTSNPQVDALSEPQSVGEALAAADVSTEPTEPTDADVPPAVSTPGLEDAVAAAGAVVDAAVADPAAHVDHLEQARTDITAALNTWPGDPNLLDLKVQLDDLAADAMAAEAPVADGPPAA